jgi:thioredoxin reductase (NADPH)
VNNKIYDVIIVGSGPAGLTASIYASRYKLSNLVIGKQLGGELSLAHRVENYPGLPGTSGLELTTKWREHAEGLGVQVMLKEVGKIELVKPATDYHFRVYISDKEVYLAKTIIVTTGSERRRLNIPGEKEYVGRGISYCFTCDAPFFKGKTVVLVGGSDSAVSGAVHTADYAQKVYIVYRGEQLRAEPVWIEEWKKIEASKKGETIYKTNLTEILGDGVKVTGVKFDQPYKGQTTLSLDGVFIEIGGVPGTSLVQPLGVKVDPTGHVVVDDKMNTNIEGLFCAGDMVSKSSKFKQAIWAMAQGAVAAASAYECLKKESAPQIRGV